MDAGCSTDDLAGFVPSALECRGEVVENRCVAKDTWIVRLACPELARQITPGQFFMVRDPRVTDPMLGRPFALLDVWKDAEGQVAGGIGVTPFLAVANEALGVRTYGESGRNVPGTPKSVSLCYGARSKEHLACVDLFQDAGANVDISTDDGSFGRHGFVTDSLKNLISGDTPPESIYCCGPEPMMQAVAEIAAESRIPCWLSLETPMACGFGICFRLPKNLCRRSGISCRETMLFVAFSAEHSGNLGC